MSREGSQANALFQVDVHHQWGTQVAAEPLVAHNTGAQPQAQPLVGQRMVQQFRYSGTSVCGS